MPTSRPQGLASTVPKQPVNHCYYCRAGEHEKCDENRMTLCACNHAGHPTKEAK